jgi:hypothetical protein
MHITGMGHEDVYWIHLAQNEFQWWSLVSIVMKNPGPIKEEKFLPNWATLKDSSFTELLNYTGEFVL